MKKKLKIDCDYCGGFAYLTKGHAVYPLRIDLHQKLYYHCKPCEAYVGVHKGTTKPLGRVANAHLRRLKMQAHGAFDPIWKKGFKKRQTAYSWLAKKLNIKTDDCHIGMFDIDTCRKVIEISNEYMESNNVR